MKRDHCVCEDDLQKIVKRIVSMFQITKGVKLRAKLEKKEADRREVESDNCWSLISPTPIHMLRMHKCLQN